MGGRGSGGSRSGGSIGKNYNVNSRSFTDTVKDEMANLTDAELKKAITNTRNASNLTNCLNWFVRVARYSIAPSLNFKSVSFSNISAISV